MYDHLDENRERKERYWEKYSTEKLVDWQLRDETPVTRPIDHVWWRQLMAGNFIDLIFDCPYELSELVSRKAIGGLLDDLDENRKEIMYYRVIRQWSPQKIAAFRGQTDRNIRKVFTATIDDMQRELYHWLWQNCSRGMPLTTSLRKFCRNYCLEQMDNGKKIGTKKQAERKG